MTALGHIATASLVRGHPILRIAWGFASHALLDYNVPEYRPKDLHLTNYRTWFHPWLLLQVVGCLFFALITGDWWAVVYGLLPDAIEAVYVKLKMLTGDNVWMTGKLLFPWHRAKHATEWTSNQTVLLELTLLILAVYR